MHKLKKIICIKRFLKGVWGKLFAKSFSQEKHETDRFLVQSKKVRDLAIDAEKLIIMNSPVMQLTMYGCILMISWLGAKHIVA